MATNDDKAIIDFNKAIQNYNRQIRHTRRFASAQAKPQKDDLIDLEASLAEYLAIVEVNYKVLSELGIQEFDGIVATIRSNHEQLIASLRISEPDEPTHAFFDLRNPPLPGNREFNERSPMSSRRSSVSNSSSNQSVQILTDALALSMRMNRIGPLEVEVFFGKSAGICRLGSCV